jgi:two-component system sensor histidine kinase BaeS
MKIKSKLITVMTSIVVLMMLLFIFLIQIQFFVARDITYFSQKKEMDRIKQKFISYYQKEHSWKGITNQAKPTSFPFVLLDARDQIVWKAGNQGHSTILAAAFPIVLTVNDQKIGILYVLTPQQQQVFFIKNTWDNYMYGVVGMASLVGTGFAFLLILIVSGTLTKPIRVLTEKIRAFEAGKADVDFQLKRKDEFREIGDALASMKDNLLKAETARKALVSNVAHELKTPLMVIQGEIELLHIQQKPVSAEKYASISSEIERLTTIVNDILYLSKVEANQMEMKKQQLQLSALFAKLASQTAYLFDHYQAKLILPDVSEQVIYADENRLLQVLYNLVQNALQHGKTTSKVTITASTTRSESVLTVSDDGVGIPEKDLDLIFERFFRGDSSRSRMTGGTGIGLSIVKAYIEMQGGTISVESKECIGTTFTIRLPNHIALLG